MNGVSIPKGVSLARRSLTYEWRRYWPPFWLLPSPGCS